jgi:hypothetical protein
VPDARGEERDLPARLAVAAFDPEIVALALYDLEQNLEHGGIGHGDELALRQVVAGLRIERVEPSRPRLLERETMSGRAVRELLIPPLP